MRIGGRPGIQHPGWRWSGPEAFSPGTARASLRDPAFRRMGIGFEILDDIVLSRDPIANFAAEPTHDSHPAVPGRRCHSSAEFAQFLRAGKSVPSEHLACVPKSTTLSRNPWQLKEVRNDQRREYHRRIGQCTWRVEEVYYEGLDSTTP